MSPIKLGSPMIVVCDLGIAEVGKKILWYTVDTPSQKWATAACRRSWFQDSHTHTHTHTHTHMNYTHNGTLSFPVTTIKLWLLFPPVLCEERFLFLHIGFADLSVNSVEPSCTLLKCVVCVCLCGPWPLPCIVKRSAEASSWASVLKQTEAKASFPPNPSVSLSPLCPLTWEQWASSMRSGRSCCSVGVCLSWILGKDSLLWWRRCVINTLECMQMHSAEFYFRSVWKHAGLCMLPCGIWMLCVWVNDYDWVLCVCGIFVDLFILNSGI